MAEMQFDPVDTALTLALAVSGFIVTDIATFSLFNLNFGDTFITLFEADISYAYALGVAALAGTVWTNENAALDTLADDVKALDDYYRYAVMGTAGLMVAWLVMPSIAETVTSNDIWGLAFVALTTTGQFVLGWML